VPGEVLNVLRVPTSRKPDGKADMHLY